MPRHPSFLLKIFYISLSLSRSPSLFLTLSPSLPLSFSRSPSLPLSHSISLLFFSLSLSDWWRGYARDKEREGEREREKERARERELRVCWISKHARTLSVPHSVSQSGCVIILNIGGKCVCVCVCESIASFYVTLSTQLWHTFKCTHTHTQSSRTYNTCAHFTHTHLSPYLKYTHLPHKLTHTQPRDKDFSLSNYPPVALLSLAHTHTHTLPSSQFWQALL